MSINNDATLVVSGGHFYTADYSSASPVALPTDLSAPGAEWTEVGHTSLDNIITMTSDGGDATVIGTLQNKTLRTTYSPRTETIGFTLEQFDVAGLKLFYGSNATVGAGGEVQVPVDPTPTVASFLVVFKDGDNEFAFYAPKAEIYRGDDLAIGDTESLAGMPLSVKPMVHGTNKWAFAVTPLGTV